jgi:hypothetical protein
MWKVACWCGTIIIVDWEAQTMETQCSQTGRVDYYVFEGDHVPYCPDCGNSVAPM